MKTPLLQSKKWQKLQDDLKEVNFFKETEEFSYLAILKDTPCGKYLYTPYGPCAEDPKNFRKAVDDLVALAKEKQALFVRIEPTTPKNPAEILKGLKIKKSTDINPAHTWVIDLNCSDDELKAKLPSRLYRYYKKYQKTGITIETSKNPEDIKYLLDLQTKLAKTKKINTFSEDYLKTELSQDFATLYLVKYTEEGAKESKIIAAGLVFDDEDTRYNLQGAQDENYRKLHATGILTIQLILDAKAKGLSLFDCWGIAPEGAPKNHPWQGFTEFKKTFDGRAVEYAGAYDIILRSGKYRLYNLIRFINRKLRKIKA